MLNEQDKKEVRDRLAQMTESVKLIFFTQQLAGTCQYCTETERLLKQITQLSDKLDLEINNFITDKEKVDALGIDKIPATAINSTEDHGIRFYGIPTGYEFATLLEAILRVSSGDSGLPDNLKKKLKEIAKPVHIQVFVTPTCPYCTRAGLTAIQIALENTNITSDIIEVTEFPQLGQKYGVMGVPKVVINEDHGFEGALPENLFVEHVFNAVE